MKEDKESGEVSQQGSQEPVTASSAGPSLGGKVKEKRTWILRSKLEELEKKAGQTSVYLDHLQRLQAEFENYRKRNAREREEFRKIILEDMVLELLGILDNFERALEAAQATQDLQSFLTGVRMIYRQFQEALARKGVTPIEALGQSFDPRQHDAVCHEETKEQPPHQVIGQLAKGYLLHGKVIRPAKVKVSKEPRPSESGPSSSGEAGSPRSSDSGAETSS